MVPSTHPFFVVRSEYALLHSVYPGHVVKTQALIGLRGKYYDQLDIVTADGKQRSVYFDITHIYEQFN